MSAIGVRTLTGCRGNGPTGRVVRDPEFAQDHASEARLVVGNSGATDVCSELLAGDPGIYLLVAMVHGCTLQS